MISKFVNILKKKEKTKYKRSICHSVIVAAVCHVTIMARHHGNSKGKCSKITVALKKTHSGGNARIF